MAPLSNHVSLTIAVDLVGIARAGFGVPMILSGYAAWAERIRFYSSLADVAADFAVTTSPEYLAAQAMFAQTPKPESIAIGRSALPATLKYTLTPVVANSTVYTLYLQGKGVTTTTATYTSDSSATAAEIVAGLITAVNAAVGKNFTATGSTTLVITGNAAGDWFSVEVADYNNFAIVCDHADPGVATDLAAIALENPAWYCLITLYNSDAYVKAAAAWIESNERIYLPNVNESDAIKIASDGTQGTLDDLKSLGYSRTMGCWHHAPDQMFAAAWAGAVLPLEPGSETWKFKNLSGVEAATLTSTQRLNLVTRRGNSMETVAGVKITFEGTVFNTSIGYLDVRRGIDWLQDDMSKGVFGALAGASKIPYTDAGVAVIEAEVRASLKRAVAKQILAEDPAPTVTAPRVADVASADKTARNLPDVKFSGTLAGAIHKVTISGVVTV